MYIYKPHTHTNVVHSVKNFYKIATKRPNLKAARLNQTEVDYKCRINWHNENCWLIYLNERCEPKTGPTAANERVTATSHTFFQKSSSNFKILGARRVTCSIPRTQTYRAPPKIYMYYLGNLALGICMPLFTFLI